MQYAGLGAGWDTEFIPEPLHQLVIDQQCLSGVAASGQRLHEQSKSGFPECAAVVKSRPARSAVASSVAPRLSAAAVYASRDLR